jgi:glycosyltransferase involved in cell wall biosynthesis
MFSRAIERGSLIERIWTKPFIDRALEPAICRLTDRVLAVSNGAENYFASLGVARHKLLVCPCAHIDPSVPRVASSQLKARQRFRLPADAVVVGSVARLVPEKGIDTLVEGFALLVDEVSRQHLHQRLILVLAGDGFLRPQLERLASRLGIESNVVFVGTTNEVGLFLRCLDIFVLTSRTEGLPLAVQEAMWYGLPIVATAVGGIPELLADGGGVLIDPDRPGRLAEQLAQLTIDVDRRQVLGSKGTIAVETQYNIRYAYKVLADLYLSLV